MMINSRPPLRRRPRLASWIVLSALVGAFVLVAPGPARAALPVEVENLRIGFGGADVFKIGAWTPVWVQVKGGGVPFRGFLDVVVGDDDGVPTSVRQPIDLPAGETRTYVAYTRAGGRDGEFSVRFYDEGGRWLGARTRDQIARTDLTALAPDDSWILTVGRPQGVDQVKEVAGFKRSDGRESELVLTAIDAEADRLPGRWLGYDGARVVVLDTADRATLEMLAGPRGEALVEWARRGGHLVVAVGENWQAVRESSLGQALPALLTGRERVQSLEALDTFANSTKPITPPGSPAHMATKMEEVEARGGKVLASIANLPLIVRGPLGFGRVTLIGVDVEEKVFADWTDRGLFWVQALDLRRDRFQEDAGAAMMGGTGRFYATGVTDLASQLRVALEQFPRVKLVPFGLVAFLIFLYILAIGPGDYFFLKKVLKRMELTWITFPLIVTAVSLLAYFAAYRLKGNDLLVNKVDLVDVDQVSGLTRGRSWATLFSPQNRDYDLGFLPMPVDGPADAPPLAPASTGEPARPAPGVEVVTSWFGVPESQFGGMGGSTGRFSFSGGGYSYAPTGGLDRLERVRIPIWSTKTVSSRWFGPASPVVESDLAVAGFDRLQGTITNLQTYPLTDALLAFGKQVYQLGDLAPGQTIRVELQSDRTLSGELKSREPRYMKGETGTPDALLNRGDLLLSVMFHESESRRTGQEQPLGNSTLHDLDLTGQLALQRPMLVARTKRPAAQVAIGNAPNEARIEQTTLLRVVLPLKSPGARVAAVSAASDPTRP
ncbi:hypothetical protein [Planctomyces sp. SH-PL62]|uniref:hypothetical protein n=1 Tax=Planctomyces sp. SH-PL62 TaxID=1636152 RepID=UPI00078CBB83|nr:hypothetical protein [Planctomyces sp. SH-PL62]AMV36478.1 hypothetical protein VT85_03535 [Planctomyces sp. SH-PL62]